MKDASCQDRDIFNTCTKHRPCDEGWQRCQGLAEVASWFGSTKCCRRPPDSSWEVAPEAGGFKYKKIRRNRGLTPIGKTGCNSNREYQDGMCYKPCTDRGPIKYRGMATMCSPEGGAGIHLGKSHPISIAEAVHGKSMNSYHTELLCGSRDIAQVGELDRTNLGHP